MPAPPVLLQNQYEPVQPHWFYCKEVEDKQIWMPFSILDSAKLEEIYNSGKSLNRGEQKELKENIGVMTLMYVAVISNHHCLMLSVLRCTIPNRYQIFILNSGYLCLGLPFC